VAGHPGDQHIFADRLDIGFERHAGQGDTHPEKVLRSARALAMIGSPSFRADPCEA